MLRGSPGTLITLDGSDSVDPDGGDLTFQWAFSSGPEAIALNGETTPRPSFTPQREGVYVFRLVVRDESLTASAPDFAEVRVSSGGGDGCGCGAGQGAGSSAGWLLLLIPWLRRRR
jgi:uncharacterized protein (TIGR03382 family)